jgi:hypothetical protein
MKTMLGGEAKLCLSSSFFFFSLLGFSLCSFFLPALARLQTCWGIHRESATEPEQ